MSLNLIQSDPNLIPLTQFEMNIVSKLSSYQSIFSLYKDPKLIEKIMKVVPFLELTQKSQKLQEMKKKNENNKVDGRDLFFFFLLEWFKNDFFKWFNAPNCNKCKTVEMTFKQNVEPSLDEKKWLASIVELYQCSKCLNNFRFPRFNHPIKLLETRTGRCGEWRNCFSAICVAFNYEIRLIDDCQDHVWNEIYSNSQKQWIHCDCCENKIDTPLMYEVGWNKKITFCFAISEFEYQDVTWRYTSQPLHLFKKRSLLVRESWLNNLLLQLSTNIQKNLEPSFKTFLLNRRLQELCQFLYTPNINKSIKLEELEGRSSGSLAWKIARGEIINTLVENNYTFKVNFDENDNSQSFRIVYKSASDEYIFGKEKIKGWDKCTFRYQNISRKIENDWKMTYLARNDRSFSTSLGFLIYALDLPFNYRRIKIFINIQLFSTGSADILLEPSPLSSSLLKPITLKFNQVNTIERDKLPLECNTIYLKITLSNGEGENAWQHAQIFRQSLTNNLHHNSMEIIVDR